MRNILKLLSALALFAFAFSIAPGHAGTVRSGVQDDPKRWISHQMNQPPPDPVRKYKMSDRRLEEIKQLVREAEKEIKSKKAK